MNKNYYDILNIGKNASQNEIKQQYKNLVMQWHPDKNINDKKIAEIKFKEITEAYNVLSNPNKKQDYDFSINNFNYQSQNNVSFNQMDNFFNNFSYNVNNFKKFNTNSQPKKKKQTQVSDLNISLKELYNGLKKKIKIKRKRLDDNNNTIESTKILEINIKSWWKNGTKITFENEGDYNTNNHTYSNLAFIIKTSKDYLFDRQEDDLIINKKISILESLCGTSFNFNHLDNTNIDVNLNDIVIIDGYKKIYKNKGMLKKNGDYGDLIIKFKVEYPESVTEEQKKKLTECFK